VGGLPLNLWQALAYFIREASLNLVRSWRVSALAVLTIATSLFLVGIFLLLSGNLRQAVAEWQREGKIVVYLEEGSTDAERQRVAGALEDVAWIEGVEAVDSATARERFAASFPSLADLLEGWGEESLPFSFELEVAWRELDTARLESWSRELEKDPAVAAVDADRDWIAQLQAAVVVLRWLGWTLGSILLSTAVFTIASVIRLTAYLYRDEISVLRLVGATEFFIRGPFYVEGLLQGLIGGALAVGFLAVGHGVLLARHGESLILRLAAEDFLGLGPILTLLGLGALAGLVGAAVSLRREALGQASAPEDWPAD